MSTRPILESSRIAPAAAAKIESLFPETISEIRTAIERAPVVVVGMSQNPHVKNVRKALEAAGVEFEYLEYGSYISEWRRRLAIKLWSGWPTFPQVFVRGTLIGGEDLTKAALADGTLQAQVGAKDSAANAVPA